MKKYFYPRPPRGGRRVGLINPLYHVVISIHALREEGDPLYPIRPHQSGLFLSTPSARRATDPARSCPPGTGISIHALREEGDTDDSFTPELVYISIHALREEGDSFPTVFGWGVFLFLSTPSARRATPSARTAQLWGRNFYPRPPRGGRRHRMPP